VTTAVAGRAILFVCAAPGHDTVRPDQKSETLTVHQGKWAVCRAGLPDGHAWAETAAIAFEDLFRAHILENRRTK
jgi:hypothetical protein